MTTSILSRHRKLFALATISAVVLVTSVERTSASTPLQHCGSAWNTSQSYNAGVVVSYAKRNWLATRASQGQFPATNPGSWQQLGLCTK